MCMYACSLSVYVCVCPCMRCVPVLYAHVFVCDVCMYIMWWCMLYVHGHVPLYSTLISGSRVSTQITHYLLFYRMAAPECLPLILEPESRFFTDPVLVLDFQSLYPSIIIAHNYCYSTCLGKMKHLFRYEHFLIAPCSVFF